MALATQCPHCQTRFRVASDQLKLRGGIVRCGACQRIFDGSAHLIDLEAPAAAAPAPGPATAPAAPSSVEAPSPAPAESPAGPPAPVQETPLPAPQDTGIDFASQPVYTLDFDSTFDPLGILPKTAPDAAQAAVHAVPQDPEPPHGDVLAHALEATSAAEAEVEVDVDLPPDDPEPAAGQLQDAEPPHGDVLAHALEAAAGADAAADSPPPGIEPALQLHDPEPHAPEPHAPEPQQDPEPPHGDALSHAVDAATFIPSNRIEPRLEGDAAPAEELGPAPAAPPAAELPPAVSFALPGRIEPSFDLPVDEELVAQALPGHEPELASELAPELAREQAPEPEPAPASAGLPQAAAAADIGADEGYSALPLRASAGGDATEPAAAAIAPAPRSARAKAAEARARRSRLTPTRIEAPKLRVPESDEPEFVKRSRKQEQSGRTRRILMAVGAAVLLLVLAAQLVLNFGNVLAARYPGARPALGGACALLGCRLALPTQIDNLAIENGELTTLGPDTYSLNTLLRNQGSLVQAWPSIELELTDANDKPVLRRVFAPGEYLPPGAAMAAGFGGRSEQPVKLHFALADLKPSGYHIFIFYP